MALSNYERIGKAMEPLRQGPASFVAREFRSLCRGQALAEASRRLDDDRMPAGQAIAAGR